MSTSRFLLSLVAGLTLVPLAAAREEPTLEQRLTKLAESLESARERAHIPGMSIAIVKDDEVVWARGFGLADVDAERPADESTVYAIGSTTKAFTATLLGMLADEGKANWDDPVTQYLPYFDLQVQSADTNAECTIRDLLSHRHGFSRMSILWFGSTLSREEVLRTAAGAEPWDDFRENFHYCNVAYLAAGEAAGVASGSTWDEMMAKRIFVPLGMTASTVSTQEAQRDRRLALGYLWDKVDERVEHEEMIDLETIGPAGSVNSNVVDMAQWLRLQLGGGEVDGTRLISAERLRETWAPQIEIADGVSYGLGWMLREYEGRKVVEHGGNIDGFSAQIGLIPEENLGYVLLMNLSASPLQQASLSHVFDALLEEWPEEPQTLQGEEDGSTPTEAEAIDFGDFQGIYVANFAQFRDEEFEVLVNDDRMALDVPGQLTFDLNAPNGEGKWTFAMSDEIAVSFQRDDLGAVVGLTMHQSGFDFEVPRKGVEIVPEVPATELEKYVGTYVREIGGKRVKLSIVQGRLTMEDKGNWLAFTTPDAEGYAPLRARADQGATFHVDAEGNVESFMYHGTSGDRLFNRLAAKPEGELPTLDEIHALRKTDARIAALKAAGGTRVTGRVWVAQAGVQGTLVNYAKGSDRYASHMDFGKFGRVDLVARGEEAWRFTSMRGFDVLKGDELAQALLDHPGAVEGDWNDHFDSIEVVRNDTVEVGEGEAMSERPVHVVRLKKGKLPSRTYWIDAEHGDLLRVKQVVVEGPVKIPVTINQFDFKELGGIRYASRVEISNPETGRMVMTLDPIQTGLELGDEAFTLTDPDAKK